VGALCFVINPASRLLVFWGIWVCPVQLVLSRIHCVLKWPHWKSFVKLKRDWTHGRFQNFGPPQKSVLACHLEILYHSVCFMCMSVGLDLVETCR
jgi:hypothetical protein